MFLHVDAHEEGAKITDFIIILHLIDSHIFDFQLGNHKHGGIEPCPDTEVYFLRIGTVHLVCGIAILPENRTGYRHQTEK